MEILALIIAFALPETGHRPSAPPLTETQQLSIACFILQHDGWKLPEVCQ